MQIAATPQEAAQYLLTHLHQLAGIAQNGKLPVVASLLKMAALEAAMVLPGVELWRLEPPKKTRRENRLQQRRRKKTIAIAAARERRS